MDHDSCHSPIDDQNKHCHDTSDDCNVESSKCKEENANTDESTGKKHFNCQLYYRASHQLPNGILPLGWITAQHWHTRGNS